MYTLVSASVLALDLVRHPAGPAVADVVDRALALDAGTVVPDGQAAVVDLDRGAARQRLLTAADTEPHMAVALRAVTSSLSAGGGSLPAGAAQELQCTLLGRLDDLVALLEDELPVRRQLPRSLVDAAVDAAVAAWAEPRDDVASSDVRALQAPWAALVGEVPAPPPGSGDVRALLELLEAVARADAAAWALLGTAHDAQHAGLRWSELLHSASRAAVEHDRTVDVARWQLSAVRATGQSGRAATLEVPGAVLSLVGAVAALALRDVLPSPVREELVAPCRLALGLLRA